MKLTDNDLNDLKYAKYILENPGIAAKVMDYIGPHIEKRLEMLPQGWSKTVTRATQFSLEKALMISLNTLDNRAKTQPLDFFHKLMVAATGAAGGAFGLAGLAIELPVSTCVMFRSIGDIARSHGEQLQSPDVQIACMEVFALGGRSQTDDATESAYFLIRSVLAKSVTEAVNYVAERGIIEEGAPVLLRLIAQVATRFEIDVTEKLAAQAIPLIGAAGGAAINVMFMNHFQDMAHGHFTIRRLQRTYSPEFIESEYRRL